MVMTAAVATLVEGKRDLWGWLAILTSPAAVGVVLAGQNTFLSVIFLYGGLRLLDRSPAVAGVLLSLLSYKPQIWILVPVALLAARQWRALAWMAGTLAMLLLASLALFGFDFWLAFLEASREAMSTRVAEEMFGRVFMHITTLLAAARIVGLPPAVGGAIQLAGAVLAVVAVWHAFRHHRSSDARTAILVTATFLISPYVLNYDLLLLMPAVVALFRQGVAQGFYPLERLIYIALWLIPTYGMILNRLDLPVMPLVILLFGGIAWTRLRGQPKVELPGTETAG
jgi:alpha-1,2-mannosyltransferase